MEVECEAVSGIGLDQNIFRWPDFVNKVMSFEFPPPKKFMRLKLKLSTLRTTCLELTANVRLHVQRVFCVSILDSSAVKIIGYFLAGLTAVALIHQSNLKYVITRWVLLLFLSEVHAFKSNETTSACTEHWGRVIREVPDPKLSLNIDPTAWGPSEFPYVSCSKQMLE
jgi:hypothetical protein